MTGNSEHPTDRVPAPHDPQQPLSEPTGSDGAAVLRPAPSAGKPRPRWLGQLAMVALGIVAAALGAQLIDLSKGLLPLPVLEGEPPYPAELLEATDRAMMGDTAIGFALAGALLAAAVGAGLCFPRGASRPAVSGLLTGLVAGALFGALGGVLNTLMFRQLVDAEMDELFQAMLIHAPFWICMSIAIALTLSLPLPELSFGRVIGATLGAAILASILYPLVSMMLFPAAHSDRVVPTEFGTRLLCFTLGGTLLSWSAARSVPDTPDTPDTPQAV